MMEITGHWENLEQLPPELLDELKPKAELAVLQAVTYFSNELKLTLTGQRTGRVYRVSKRGPPHIASAPGEPPAVLTGALRNSVGFSRPVWDGLTVEAEVGVGLGTKPKGGKDPFTSYARRLEFGGVDRRGIRILPRPYMEPTSIRVEPMIDQILQQEA